DPELRHGELTAVDIARYMGPGRYHMLMEALMETGRMERVERYETSWEASDFAILTGNTQYNSGAMQLPRAIYGAADLMDGYNLLHWASYNGSPKVRKLLLMRGADPEHLGAIEMEEPPTKWLMRPMKYDGLQTAAELLHSSS